VLLYCARSFQDPEPGLGRFARVLTALAGALPGLVRAADVMVLYPSRQLPTVSSSPLIGHYQAQPPSRRPAPNALIRTTAGGLAMLVGLLMFAHAAGSMLLSDIMASGIWADADPYLIAAMLLVLAGAMTKSALVPTHFWLP